MSIQIKKSAYKIEYYLKPFVQRVFVQKEAHIFKLSDIAFFASTQVANQDGTLLHHQGSFVAGLKG